MAHVITFVTSKFDITRETPNPVNPIAGQSVLLWLRDALRGSPYEATAPATEDWGWYVDVKGAGALYLVGASADASEPETHVEWTVQIHKHRSLKEKLTGTSKLAADDPLSMLIERLIRADTSIRDVAVDRAG